MPIAPLGADFIFCREIITFAIEKLYGDDLFSRGVHKHSCGMGVRCSRSGVQPAEVVSHVPPLC